jgi:hypothetical protein
VGLAEGWCGAARMVKGPGWAGGDSRAHCVVPAAWSLVWGVVRDLIQVVVHSYGNGFGGRGCAKRRMAVWERWTGGGELKVGFVALFGLLGVFGGV